MWDPIDPGSETYFTEERVISGMMAVCEKPRDYSAFYCLMDITKLTTQLTVRSLRTKLKDISIDSILNSIYLPKTMIVLL